KIGVEWVGDADGRDPSRGPDEILEIMEAYAGFFVQLSRRRRTHGVELVIGDILFFHHAAGECPDVRRKAAFFRAPNHEHFERMVAQQQHAGGGNGLYFCHPTHSSPPGPRSFFQIGTVCLKRSMTARHASKGSPGWGAEHAMTIEASPTFKMPSRCSTATRTFGKRTVISSNIFVISFSAIGR